jgi:hypothetical protein
MKVEQEITLEHIPTISEKGLDVYDPSDIKRWGVERFLDAVAPKESLHFGIAFSEDENRRMDEIIAQEKNRK